MGKKQTHKGPTGLPLVDKLETLEPTIDDYLAAASEYVRRCREISTGAQKAAQFRMSAALGKVLLRALQDRVPALTRGRAGEHVVSGALRPVKADVSEFHELDGLRLAIELKPVNLAVGRAIWNRFGDVRTFAVNLHLKFPFAVVGGVLVIPTYEEVTPGGPRKATAHLIERAANRLIRAGGRRNEGDAPHLLEAIAVVVYDPETHRLDPKLPPPGSGLRWDEFINALAVAYDTRFGEGQLVSGPVEEDE